jgi:extracellular factor (EF) 3-hydroxypalmitic acid methyl ester biosynthesis protein
MLTEREFGLSTKTAPSTADSFEPRKREECVTCRSPQRCASLDYEAEQWQVEEQLHEIRRLVKKGGPDPKDYDDLTLGLEDLATRLRGCRLATSHCLRLREALGEAMDPRGMQGFGYSKPHGYPGDFEMMDRIYTRRVSNLPHLQKWDLFFHSQAAPTAVRNRREYLHTVLSRRMDLGRDPNGLTVLNVASGPARDLFEFFTSFPEADVIFHCVEVDPHAIEYAKSLCFPFLDRIVFHNFNAFTFRSDRRFGLIWSAGLFDYLSDALGARLARRLHRMLSPDGELVIGNFGPANSSRGYMELIGDWFLEHREPGRLRRIGLQAGAEEDEISISQEPSGVNLFLHMAARGRKPRLMEPPVPKPSEHAGRLRSHLTEPEAVRPFLMAEGTTRQ